MTAPDTEGTPTNEAEVTGVEPDADLMNNTVSVDTMVEEPFFYNSVPFVAKN